MKAMVYTRYGPPEVLSLKEMGKPVPRDNEVLVKVHATTVTPMDFRFRQGTTLIARFMTGLLKPKNPILGVELAGGVETVGRDVRSFKKGDQVYGGGGPYGTHAEYACLPEDKLAVKPTSMTYEEAAAVHFSAGTALDRRSSSMELPVA
jgi:NADPH:quinone reductase-like Zn-dependent oxidoreductase